AYLDGCRGGAIYMYNVRNVTVKNCVARNYNGDGISFQISDNVHILNSESYGHTGYGVHPGTGSANSEVERCHLHNNADIGLFLRSEEHTSELQSRFDLVCRLLLEKKKSMSYTTAWLLTWSTSGRTGLLYPFQFNTHIASIH